MTTAWLDQSAGQALDGSWRNLDRPGGLLTMTSRKSLYNVGEWSARHERTAWPVVPTTVSD